jgi:hypothetical protein
MMPPELNGSFLARYLRMTFKAVRAKLAGRASWNPEVLLLTPGQVDALFQYPRGRTSALVRQGLLPGATLPNGEIRLLGVFHLVPGKY